MTDKTLMAYLVKIARGERLNDAQITRLDELLMHEPPYLISRAVMLIKRGYTPSHALAKARARTKNANAGAEFIKGKDVQRFTFNADRNRDHRAPLNLIRMEHIRAYLVSEGWIEELRLTISTTFLKMPEQFRVVVQRNAENWQRSEQVIKAISKMMNLPELTVFYELLLTDITEL